MGVERNPNWVFFRSDAIIDDACPTAHGIHEATLAVLKEIHTLSDQCERVLDATKDLAATVGTTIQDIIDVKLELKNLRAAHEGAFNNLHVDVAWLERELHLVRHNTLVAAKRLAPHEAKEEVRPPVIVRPQP